MQILALNNMFVHDSAVKCINWGQSNYHTVHPVIIIAVPSVVSYGRTQSHLVNTVMTEKCVLIVDFSDISSGFLSHSAFFKKPWEYFNEMQFWVFTRSFYNPLFLHSSHALMLLLNRLDRYLSSWKVIFGFNFQTDDLILSSRKLLQCRIHSWISAILAVPEAMTKQ